MSRACDGKTLYRSRKVAEHKRHAQEALTGEKLRVYFCAEEGGWHLTHKPFDATRPGSRR